MAGDSKIKKPVAPPTGVNAYRIDTPADELVVFVWESEPHSSALAPVEREVLRLVLTGLSNSQIAVVRGTSVRTVANQVATLLKKLGARSRFELIGRLSGDAGADDPLLPR